MHAFYVHNIGENIHFGQTGILLQVQEMYPLPLLKNILPGKGSFFEHEVKLKTTLKGRCFLIKWMKKAGMKIPAQN